MIGTKPLRIRYNKIDRFIRIYNGTRSLVLFGPQKCDVKKVNYVCFFSLLHENQSWFFYSLPIEKTLTLRNLIIHIKSVLNKYQYHYYYSMFLEECSYQLRKK